MTVRHVINIWTDGDPEPESFTVTSPETWGTAAEEIDMLRAELRDMQADGVIDRYTISAQNDNSMTAAELLEKLEQLRRDSDQ